MKYLYETDVYYSYYVLAEEASLKSEDGWELVSHTEITHGENEYEISVIYRKGVSDEEFKEWKNEPDDDEDLS